MSPRPRTVADSEILAAAATAIHRVGPVKLTLAHVAREAKLSPATLVQRFGSKRGLLLALAELGAGSAEACFDQAARAHRSPLAALLSAATELTRHMNSPEALANGLAFLQMDISDPDFHRLALAHSRATVAGYRTLIEAAVEAGELARCDSAALARAVGAVAGGSLIAWALHRRGPAEKWVRRDLETLIAPHRVERPARAIAARRSDTATARNPKRRLA